MVTGRNPFGGLRKPFNTGEKVMYQTRFNLKKAAKEFIEKHKADRIQVDYIERQFGSVEDYLEQEGEYDTFLVGGNTYIEIDGADTKSGHPEIIEWYQTEWQVGHYDLPHWERRGRGEWTVNLERFNDFDEAISHIQQLLAQNKADITLSRMKEGEFEAIEDWKFYIAHEAGHIMSERSYNVAGDHIINNSETES
ncbi:MAG: hypothetical protein CMF55_06765 [Legionellales bacterium]|nr:hypothetical protein [Legionellales bacterium]